MLKHLVLADKFPVEIFNEKKEKVQDAASINEAARICRIKSTSCIWNYLFIKRTRKQSAIFTGVRSPITGKRYHFKLKQQ